MPLIIGPERYQPMGDVTNCWMKLFLAENRGDCLDIYGMHYYPKHREIFDKLEFELSLIGVRRIWEWMDLCGGAINVRETCGEI